MDTFNLVQHHIVRPDGSLPETTGCLYAYILAGNGLFVRAKRPGLEALIPVFTGRIAGLPRLTPRVHLARRVPQHLLLAALNWSKEAFPNEALFWFNLEGKWSIYMPPQRRGRGRVVPFDLNNRKGTSALVDLHSHAGMSPFFSPTDDRDERGFRLYAVLGNLNRIPTIHVRVGVYAHFYDLPASTVFELPENILDIHTAYKKEQSINGELEQGQPVCPKITAASPG